MEGVEEVLKEVSGEIEVVTFAEVGGVGVKVEGGGVEVGGVGVEVEDGAAQGCPIVITGIVC